MAIVGISLAAGSALAWEGPVEKLIETREEDRDKAVEEGQDPVDAFFAPADDAFADMNRDMNRESDADSAPEGTAAKQK